MAMDKKIKKEWLRRLRSGEIKQGKRALQRGQNYCCLGVLCQMAVEEGFLYKENGCRFTSFDNIEDSQTSVLPRTVLDWVGLPIFDSSVFLEGERENLAFLNDKDGMSFKEIADIIEKNL